MRFAVWQIQNDFDHRAVMDALDDLCSTLSVCFFQMFKVKISPETIHIPFYLVYNTNFKTSEYFFCH